MGVVNEFYFYKDTETVALAEVIKLSSKSVARIGKFFRLCFSDLWELPKH
jgi:hypothetical protein